MRRPTAGPGGYRCLSIGSASARTAEQKRTENTEGERYCEATKNFARPATGDSAGEAIEIKKPRMDSEAEVESVTTLRCVTCSEGRAERSQVQNGAVNGEKAKTMRHNATARRIIGHI
jgi:hypothetical protein